MATDSSTVGQVVSTVQSDPADLDPVSEPALEPSSAVTIAPPGTAGTSTVPAAATTVPAAGAPADLPGFGNLGGEWFLEFVDVSPPGGYVTSVVTAERVTVGPDLAVVSASAASLSGAPSCPALPAGTPMFSLRLGIPDSYLPVEGTILSYDATSCAQSDSFAILNSSASLWGDEQVITFSNNSKGWRMRRSDGVADLSGRWVGNLDPDAVIGADQRPTAGRLAQRDVTGEPYEVLGDPTGYSVVTVEEGHPADGSARCTAPPGTVVMTFTPTPDSAANAYTATLNTFDYATCQVVLTTDVTISYDRTLSDMFPSLHTPLPSGPHSVALTRA